jgi:Protein of unknown function (DUF4231)
MEVPADPSPATAPPATPAPAASASASVADPDTAVAELATSMAFYDRGASRNKLLYQNLRVLTLVLAAAIPVVGAFGGPAEVTAVLGGAIVIVEGLQQLFQFHDRWVDYRKTWNELDQERRLHQLRAGPYASGNPDKRLGERMTMILAAENSDWVALAANAGAQSSA